MRNTSDTFLMQGLHGVVIAFEFYRFFYQTLYWSVSGVVVEVSHKYNLGLRIFGSNSAANSNGDDTIALVNPSGQVVDLFGQIGIDGSGTAHEFEDGRALRILGVLRGSRSFKSSEWIIHNDTGASGTIKQLLSAPQDYNPGTHLIE